MFKIPIIKFKRVALENLENQESQLRQTIKNSERIQYRKVY